jgi:hypothetical protein
VSRLRSRIGAIVQGPWPRIGAAAILAAAAAAWSLSSHPEIYSSSYPRSDFAMLHAGAEAWQRGIDPYKHIGPGRDYDLPFPLVYPFTALLAAVPFTWLPAPDACFVAFGSALFGWAIFGRSRGVWLACLTPAFILNVQMSQWSALLIGAALVPGWSFLLACKPTIGAALFAAYPSRRTFLAGAAFAVVSVMLLPTWPVDWIANLPTATHTRAPVTFWGGPLILIALYRWRDPGARLLVALSLVPHTPELYESLPLFLIPSTVGESALLALLNWGVVMARQQSSPAPDYVSDMALTGQWMVWLLYLPCLVFVLRKRPQQLPTAVVMPPVVSPTDPGTFNTV